MIKGKNQPLVWKHLQKKAADLKTDTIPWNSRKDISEALGREATDELIQQSTTILSRLEALGLLKRLGAPHSPNRSIQLLYKQSGPYKLVPFNITSIMDDKQSNLPLQFIPKTYTNNGTKMSHAVANATFFRKFFSEEKEKNPNATISKLVELAANRIHERVESGNFRYLIGRSMEYSIPSLFKWVHGYINDEKTMDDLMPAEKRSPSEAMVEKVIGKLKLPEIDTSNLSTKEDMDSIKKALTNLQKEWNNDFSKLLVALYSGANGGEKSAIARMFPDIPQKANTLHTQ